MIAVSDPHRLPARLHALRPEPADGVADGARDLSPRRGHPHRKSLRPDDRRARQREPAASLPVSGSGRKTLSRRHRILGMASSSCASCSSRPAASSGTTPGRVSGSPRRCGPCRCGSPTSALPIGFGLMLLQYVVPLSALIGDRRGSVSPLRRRAPHRTRDDGRRAAVRACRSASASAFVAMLFLLLFDGPQSLTAHGGAVLRPARQLHAARDPDVHRHGRRGRRLESGCGPLRRARPVALPSPGRTRHLESRGLRVLLGALGLVARDLRRHRKDGHPGDARARLQRRDRRPAPSRPAARSESSSRPRSR